MITRDQIAEHEAHKFTAFASDLNLRPGTWPLKLEAAADVGNGQVFVRISQDYDREGELTSVTYTQALGCVTLVVYND